MRALFIELNSKPARSGYWALFRLYLCFHIGNQIFAYYALRDVLFSDKGLLYDAYGDAGFVLVPMQYLQRHMEAVLFAYLLIVCLLALGIGKQLTTLCMLFATKVVQTLNPYILNGGHNFLFFALFYLCFADSFQYFCLNPLKYRSQAIAHFSNYLTKLATASLLLHLMLVYFISGLAKAHADVWYHGDALYYILQLDRFQGTALNSALAQNGYLVTLLSYGTMFWELLFPALVWVKNARILVLAIGVAMHLGISVFMMLYDFELLFIVAYGFFLRDDEWQRLCSIVKATTLRFYSFFPDFRGAHV